MFGLYERCSTTCSYPRTVCRENTLFYHVILALRPRAFGPTPTEGLRPAGRRQAAQAGIQGIAGLGLASRLSKLVAHLGSESGSAAVPCGKPPAFRPSPSLSLSPAQAGRLSLPACGEEVNQDGRPSERRSLSANQAAEPQFVTVSADSNLDKSELCPTPVE